MINHSGQVGGSMRESVSIINTTFRFKPIHPVKEIRLMRSGTNIEFKLKDDWIEFSVPQLNDFEMVLCLYR